MARFIALSSMVARGHVGLSAMVPVLQRLGHEVTGLPTVVLSNHLGHRRSAGMPVSAETLSAMLDALDANGWLGEADGVLTGYLASAEHVHFAANLIDRVRQQKPEARIFCDPVLGDDPKGLYIGQETALAVRDVLLAHADVMTPNRFELAWLSGMPVTDVASAIGAARALGLPAVLATSIPLAGETLANLLITPTSALKCVVPRRTNVPHGTGDFLAAAFAGFRLSGTSERESLGRATAATAAVIDASLGRDELCLVAMQETWPKAEALPVEPV